MKLSEAIDALCLATRANGRSPATVYAYREKLGHLVRFLGGDAEVENITVHDLRRFLADQWDRGLSPFTVSSLTRAVKRLFNFLVAEAILERNPCKGIVTPDPPRGEPKGVSPQDVVRLLETTQAGTVADLRDRAIVLFLGDTGCRAGGLCGLEIGSLDLDNMRARVTEKRGKSRFVMFTEPTRDALKAWLAVRPQGKGKAVFIGVGNKSRGALKPNGLGEMLRRRAKRAGITASVGPHGFRHAFARFYLLDGGDLGTLSDLLGHGDVSITKKWYGIFKVGELQAKHREHSPILRMFGEGGKSG